MITYFLFVHEYIADKCVNCFYSSCTLEIKFVDITNQTNIVCSLFCDEIKSA